MNIVEVLWFDAQSSLDIFKLKDIDVKIKPVYTKSIGYLVKENKDYIILAFMMFGDDVFKHWQLIPKGMIKYIKKIKNK